ncbi:MAG: aminotransferase class V-fold PLP-dependent enzyme [Halobacteriaceae archaeon]
MDPADLRSEMPGVEDIAYLNTGASGPSPRRVVDAMRAVLEAHEYRSPGEEGMYTYAFEALETARESAADLLGADPAEVALTQSTTDGINRLACAIDWQPGDVVVRTDLEHAAGVLPWRRLADLRDVEVRVVETSGGRLDVDRVKDAVDGARLVCLSSLTWTHGTRLPVSAVVDVAHDAGAHVLVDAVQSPGQHPVDVREWGADFVAAAGHKWLLGPWGAGMLYVDADATAALAPRVAGYRGVEDAGDEGVAYKAGARRLEVGTVSPAPHAGLVAAVDLLEEVGIDAVQSRIERLTDRLKAGLGDRLLGPREYESGLVTFTDPDPDDTVQRLEEAGVYVRSLPNPDVDGRAVRASVHAFNTADDVDALLDAL